MRSVCVFCGSSLGADRNFASAAKQLGSFLAATGRTLVYGGGSVGLMGIVADAALAGGGTVIGVIPRALADKELVHRNLSDLRVVESMHERKALMAQLANGFVALPGGIGTLEEFVEVWTWGQLGLHAKPYGLLDVGGFFSRLIDFLDWMVEKRFLRSEHREMLLVEEESETLLCRMAAQRATYVSKWINVPTT